MNANAQIETASDGDATCLKKNAALPASRPSAPAGLNAVVGEDAEQDDAEQAADAVDAPDVERVVPLEPVLERDGVVADDAGSDADHDRGRPARRSRPPA